MDKLGLTSNEAVLKLKEFGRNEVVESKKLSGFFAFLSRFKNPLLLILIVSALVSGFLGDPVTATIIILVVLASVTVDFVNTHRSEKAAEDLKKRVMLSASVVRDGTAKEISFAEIVPGDVVVLSVGDIVPADGEVFESKDLYTNESQLTGESFPVEKNNGQDVFMGSSITTGRAYLLVKQTGKNTKFSHIAESLLTEETPTEFDIGIKKFSVLIMRITFFLVFFIFLFDSIFKRGIFESFMFGLALAVGLTPELLPMIIALNLSRGSLDMAKRGVIVKKLSAIQNFGNMDILCTDKTGTLTQDQIKLVKYVDADGNDSEKVLLAGYLNSLFSGGFKNPLDEAIKDYKNIDITTYKKIDEVPFDFERRRDSVVVGNLGNHILIAKGAPEQVIEACSFFGDQDTTIDDSHRKKIISLYEKMSMDGFRIIAVAHKILPESEKTYSKEDEIKMTFLGFIAFIDPAKESVKDTLKALENYGIEIKILTGDNEFVTQKIAGDISLPIKDSLLGSDIEKMSDIELATRAEHTTIFARVNPEQKERIIKALRSKGHVVGFLGDGINDAPPLRAADVGISVENAVDVAKDTADLILLKKSLNDLIEGVIEGRRTFANTLKYMMMNLSSNFGNMFSMAGASAIFPFLPMTPPQILLNNFLYDSSQFAIPTDNVDDSYLLKPRRLKMDFIKKFMFIFGPISSVFDFITFYVLFAVFNFKDGAFQSGWFLESMITQIFVVYIIRTRKIPFVESFPSKPLFWSVIASVCAAWFFVYSALGKYFGFVALPFYVAFTIIIITIAYLVFIEIAKIWFFNRIFRDE